MMAKVEGSDWTMTNGNGKKAEEILDGFLDRALKFLDNDQNREHVANTTGALISPFVAARTVAKAWNKLNPDRPIAYKDAVTVVNAISQVAMLAGRSGALGVKQARDLVAATEALKASGNARREGSE